jgi:hypothetical protein
MLRAQVLSLFLVSALASAWAQQPENPRQIAISAMYPVMIKALETGNFGQARNICDQWIMWEPENPNHHYNLACIEARAGGSRLQHAIPALQRAAELGFPEIGTLKNDPDLAPIRSDPRFAGIEQKVMRSAEAKERMAATQKDAKETPPPMAQGARSPRAIENLALDAAVDSPAPATFANGMPVGLYFMTRFWSFTGTLEKLVWYFAPDGTVYQSLEHGFSATDLAGHAGPKGTCALQGDKLEVRWSGGKKSASRLQRSETGFSWDGGIFTPVKPFSPQTQIAGLYEGGESLSFSGNRAAVSKTFELRADGTFHWSGVSFLSSTSDASRVSAGATGEDSTGRWHASNYSIVLVDTKGNVYRRIAFPYDDEKTPVNPDRIFFGGTMFKRR